MRIAKPSIIITCLVFLLSLATVNAVADHHAKPKSVLVTGATTGIGRNLAERLASNGYHVYAGARTDDEMAELNAQENMTAVRVDVTKQEQIDAAYEW